MPREITQLQPLDIEIEKLAPGPIIHIFSHTNPEDTLEDIVAGLHLLKIARRLPQELDDALKAKEQPNYLIMAYAEAKRMNKDALAKAEKHALRFMEQLPSSSVQ
jgi:hypothetical protein